MTELSHVSTQDESDILEEGLRALDEWNEGLSIPYPRPASPLRGWLGHILYVIGIRIMEWSQIVGWGSKDWYYKEGINES